jgi:hypothetical protein
LNPRVPEGHRFSKPAPYQAWLPQHRTSHLFDTRSTDVLLQIQQFYEIDCVQIYVFGVVIRITVLEAGS